jgi:AraC-like DNA-binding protein
VYSHQDFRAHKLAGSWDETFADLHGAMKFATGDATAPWTGRLVWQESDAFCIARCSGREESVSREAKHIRTDPRGTFELLVPLAGEAWTEQGSESIRLTPGLMALCDIDRPFRFTHDESFLSLSLIVPEQRVAQRSRVAVRGPHLIGASGGLGRLIRQMVTTLHEEREQLTQPTFDGACDRLLDLVCLAAEGQTGTAPVGHRAAVEASIRQYVRAHADEESLDVRAIAASLGWSPRYVQQVLQAAGTTARDLIRSERLRLARARLGGGAWGAMSIAQIAASCGFSSHSAFSTAFRAEFGMTPSEARHR